MSLLAAFIALGSFLFLPILAQTEGHQNELANFRHNCSTPDLDGSTLTAPCQDLCSWCTSFYVSSIDLNKCVAYDGQDTLLPMINGNYGKQCTDCFTNFAYPDVLQCSCQGLDGAMHDVALDLNEAIGTRCGRLSCQGYTADLGPPLTRPDQDACGVQSNDPSGQKMVASPTAAPDLLYVRRGIVYRQSRSNSTTVTAGTTTVTVLITLTVQPQEPANTVTDGDASLRGPGGGARP